MQVQISTRFSMEELERIRTRGVICHSSDFEHLCKCGQLRLILGATMPQDIPAEYCLYSHGELLFKVPFLDRSVSYTQQQQQAIEEFLVEVCHEPGS